MSRHRPADKLPPLVPLGRAARHGHRRGRRAPRRLAAARGDGRHDRLGHVRRRHRRDRRRRRAGSIIGTTSVMATHLPSKRHDLEHGLTTAPSPLPDRGSWWPRTASAARRSTCSSTNWSTPTTGSAAAVHDGSYDAVLAAAAAAYRAAQRRAVPAVAGRFDGARATNATMRGGFVNLGLTTTRRRHGARRARGRRPERRLAAPALQRARRARRTRRSRSAVVAPPRRCGARSSPTASACRCDAWRTRRRTNAHGAALLALVETGPATLGRPALDAASPPRCTTRDAAHRLLAYQELLGAFVDFHDRAAPFYASLPSSIHEGSRHHEHDQPTRVTAAPLRRPVRGARHHAGAAGAARADPRRAAPDVDRGGPQGRHRSRQRVDLLGRPRSLPLPDRGVRLLRATPTCCSATCTRAPRSWRPRSSR